LHLGGEGERSEEHDLGLSHGVGDGDLHGDGDLYGEGDLHGDGDLHGSGEGDLQRLGSHMGLGLLTLKVT